MASFTVSLGSGSTVSSQFQLDGAATGLNIWVRSFASIGWFIAFATDSGGPFARLKRPDGTGLDFIVSSLGSGGVVTILNKPSVFGRMETSGATASSSVSVFVTETRI